MSEEDYDNRKAIHIFGTDVSKIPCFRSSFLFGIGSGISGGLLWFLKTSKTRISCHVGFSCFVVTTMGYWVQCRYSYAQQKFAVAQILEATKQQSIYQGTPLDNFENESGIEKNLKEV